MPSSRSIGMTILISVFLLLAACQATPTDVITDPGPESCQHRILVQVWSDLNDDGVWDESEPPIEGALVLLAEQSESEGSNIQMETNVEGDAFFGGFELNNCSPEGYQVLFARSVSGFAFPEDPLFRLDGFDMLHDTVSFGLVPETSSND